MLDGAGPRGLDTGLTSHRCWLWHLQGTPRCAIRSRSPLLAIAPVLLLLACGDKAGTDTSGTEAGDGSGDGSGDDGGDDTGSFAGPTGDPATVELAGHCPLEDRIGGFQVSVYEAYSVVQGSVAEGVLPVSVLTEVYAEGECRLLKRENPFCDPPCASDETCDLDEECVPYPENQDLGLVEVAGLSDPVSMTAVQPGATYFDTKLSHPAFAEGDLVELRSLGGGWGGDFDLHGVGGSPIQPGEAEWQVVEGQALTVTWDAPSEGARTTVALDLNIDQHGTSPVAVLCLMEDDGEGVIPAGVIQSLVDSGVTGYPSGSLSRHTADRAQLEAGCVDLVVEAPASVDVDVLGYTPCDKDEDCPPGQTCNVELQICE